MRYLQADFRYDQHRDDPTDTGDLVEPLHRILQRGIGTHQRCNLRLHRGKLVIEKL